jgi:hypothetical protein
LHGHANFENVGNECPGTGTVKDVQELLRHSRAATTTDVYMQEIPESVPATVNAINAELRVKREEIHADC